MVSVGEQRWHWRGGVKSISSGTDATGTPATGLAASYSCGARIASQFSARPPRTGKIGLACEATMALPVKDFENYSVTSQDYDSTRVPVGLEVILGSLCYTHKKPLSDLHILDAGCGTGNYIRPLSPHMKKITGLELNEGMFGQAKKKTADLSNVELLQGSILHMPFGDAQFDGVICNQVIHHLQPTGDTTYQNVKVFFKEVHRVLKPNGAFILNTASKEQVAALWFSTLIPKATEAQQLRYPSIALVHQFLREVGLELGPSLGLLNEVFFKGDQWLNKEGPLHQSWRNTDSMFSLSPDKELQSALKFWRKTLEEGKAEEYIAKCEEKRKAVGISTSVVAYKH